MLHVLQQCSCSQLGISSRYPVTGLCYDNVFGLELCLPFLYCKLPPSGLKEVYLKLWEWVDFVYVAFSPIGDRKLSIKCFNLDHIINDGLCLPFLDCKQPPSGLKVVYLELWQWVDFEYTAFSPLGDSYQSIKRFNQGHNEVQPCFGPSSSTMGLLIFDQVHLMLRIFSCIRWV